MKVIIFRLFVFLPGPSFLFDVSLRLSLFSSNWLCMCLPECYTEGCYGLVSGNKEPRLCENTSSAGTIILVKQLKIVYYVTV